MKVKKKSTLRIIRITIATVIILSFTFLFVDFSHTEILVLRRLPHFQIAPATLHLIVSGTIVMGAAAILIFFILLTLLFGRVYCSAICPFGILQDFITRLSQIGKKKNRRRKYKYGAPFNILRYSILAAVTVCTIFGFSAALVWLDPYSNFGRIAKNIFGLIYLEFNNLLSTAGIESLYHVSPKSFEVFSFCFSIFVLLTVGFMAAVRGRLFCNTVCPVGALLSLISRFSIFKLKLDSVSCNSCGLCAMRCKSQCIDSKNRTLDFSRCVTCYNCIDVCNRRAIGYKSFRKSETSRQQTQTSSNKLDADKTNKAITSSVDVSKRRFVTGAIVVAGAAVVSKAQELNPKPAYKKTNPITPPGAQSLKHLLSKCTACHLCISQCPTQTLKPAFMQYGLAGIMMPVMDYKTNFCNFECTVCSEICPNTALITLTTEEKKLTQIGKVNFIKELCVVYTDDTDCGACSEHCPTKAISMVEYKEILRIPEVDPNICIGCGGCEYICPVVPQTAMYIEGNPVHLVAQEPPEDKKQEVDLDDFEF